ncbi:unnamed protein product [Larinioides sclopetarius]|uniref:Uncharacterized protein n=1 Tax=Larinioides sclopetarius TaxID=280406 RepID=A0AAV2BBT4_9ARAC
MEVLRSRLESEIESYSARKLGVFGEGNCEWLKFLWQPCCSFIDQALTQRARQFSSPKLKETFSGVNDTA